MTDLKWSRFNFLVETEKHRKYLYNSYSNSLIALDDSLYASLLFLSMQKVLYFNNLFYINDLYMYMCLLRDKLGTKIGVKNAKKNKYRH